MYKGPIEGKKPTCVDGLENDTFCQFPWRLSAEWSAWEPRYVDGDTDQYLSLTNIRKCGKLDLKSDCDDVHSEPTVVELAQRH